MTDSAPPGIFVAFRRLLETFLAMAQSRLELAAVEWREEMVRAAGLLLLGAIAAFAAALAIMTITALVCFAFWDHALWVLGGFAVFYLSVALVLWRVLLRGLEKPFFVDTVAQLQKDREWLLPRN